MDNFYLFPEEVNEHLKLKETNAFAWQDVVESDGNVDLTTVLHNQLMWNDVHFFGPHFNRMSLPIVYKMFNSLQCREWLSLQSSIQAKAIVADSDSWMKLIDMDMQKVDYQVNWITPESIGSRSSDAEVDVCLYLANQCGSEIDSHVVSVMNENAVTTTEIWLRDAVSFTEDIEELCYRIESRCDHFPNWLVTSPEIISSIAASDNWDYSSGYDYQGKINLYLERAGTLKIGKHQVKVWSDPIQSVGTLTAGYRGEREYDAGAILAAGTLLCVRSESSFNIKLCYHAAVEILDATRFGAMTIHNFNP